MDVHFNVFLVLIQVFTTLICCSRTLQQWCVTVLYTCIVCKEKYKFKTNKFFSSCQISCDVINDEGIHPVLNCELGKLLLTVWKLLEKNNLQMYVVIFLFTVHEKNQYFHLVSLAVSSSFYRLPCIHGSFQLHYSCIHVRHCGNAEISWFLFPYMGWGNVWWGHWWRTTGEYFWPQWRVGTGKFHWMIDFFQLFLP